MNSKDIIEFLSENTGYLKWGKRKLADKFGVNTDIIKGCIKEVKILMNENPNKEERREFKRLFFDIETSPNIGWFWSASYKTSITTDQILDERKVICISWKWENEDKVHHLTWDENKCDKKMLQEFCKVIQEATEVVGHNSDRFDIKWLRTRCLYHRIPFNTYIKTLDTLKKVKSSFNFQSNRLNYIASLLGFGTKKPTGGSKLWLDITINNDPKAMQVMLEYCDHDVVLLEDVFNAIKSYIKPVSHKGVFENKKKFSCPNCGNDCNLKYLEAVVTQRGVIQRHMLCKDCSTDYIISDTAYKEYISNDN